MTAIESQCKAREERPVPPRDVFCRETTPHVWICTLHYASGKVLVLREAWYQNANALGLSRVSEWHD